MLGALEGVDEGDPLRRLDDARPAAPVVRRALAVRVPAVLLADVRADHDVLRLVDAELVGGGVVGVRPDPAAPPVLLLDRRANGPRAD